MIVLTWFSYYDIKYRDIPDKYVWITFGISIILFLVSIPYYLGTYYPVFSIAYIILSILLGGGVFFVLYLFGLIGKADVFLVSEISLLFPFIDIYDIVLFKAPIKIHLPPVMIIVLYSAGLTIIYMLFKTIFILLKHWDKLPRDLPFSMKLLLVLIGRPMQVGEYLVTHNYYPLVLFSEDKEGLVRKYRLTFDVESEDYREHQVLFKKLIDKGLLDPNEYIWVTYGIPYLVPLLAGFVLFLIISDLSLYYLFKLLL